MDTSAAANSMSKTEDQTKAESGPATLANYCVCFIDLLGQKEAMTGQGLLPEHATPDQYEALIRLVKSTVGRILGIHKNAAAMLAAMNRHRDPPGPLGEAELEIWRQFHTDPTVTQRWSDGLMVFTPLGSVEGHPVVHGVYLELCLAGAMCLVGLAGKAPLRGGIDIAWGVELNPGELYGPAVANAYMLESTCARFPRIAVGEHVMGYLKEVSQSAHQDHVSNVSRVYASICLGMLARDESGVIFLDYLSEGFEKAVTADGIEVLWPRARSFIDEQLGLHRHNKAEELVSRYQALAQYFDAHPPPSKRIATQ